MSTETWRGIDLSGVFAAAGLPELTPWQQHLIDSLPSGSITVDARFDTRAYGSPVTVPRFLVNPEFFAWLDREKRRQGARRRTRLSRIHTEYARRRR